MPNGQQSDTPGEKPNYGLAPPETAQTHVVIAHPVDDEAPRLRLPRFGVEHRGRVWLVVGTTAFVGLLGWLAFGRAANVDGQLLTAAAAGDAASTTTSTSPASTTTISSPGTAVSLPPTTASASTTTSTPTTSTPTTSTTITAASTDTTLATDTSVVGSPRVEIDGRRESCKFSSDCLVAGFELIDYPDPPETFTCEFSNSEASFSFGGASVTKACSTGQYGDTITIIVGGIRSSTIDFESVD